MTIAIPTLSSEGWVTTPIRKLDRALSYALTTDNLQSNTYRGNLTSIQAIVQSCLDNPSLLQEEAQNTLNSYFSRLFDVADVRVIVEDYPEEGSNLLALRIQIEVLDKEERVSADALATFNQGIFTKLVDINDHGNR